MMSNDLLKQRILDLAIHGELVDNDLSLQPVDVEAIDGEVPFDIPSNWKWSKVCNIFDVKGGKRIPKGEQFLDEGSHVYIRVADMDNMSISTNNLKYISDDVYSQISRYIITSDDLYITVAGTIGQVGSVPKELSGMNLTENANRLIPLNVDKEFYKYVFNSCFMQDSIRENTTKAAQPKLAIKRINELIIPVPPFEQQSLIANIIEELFALIDQKEKNDQEKNKLKLLLKDKILDSAIHGELVENDLSLRPVDVETIDGEVPFDIPSNWKWSKIENSVILSSGTTYSEEFISGDIMYVKVSDMNIIDNRKEILTSSRFQMKQNVKNIVPIGSIIFPKRGGAINTNKKKLVLKEPICVDLNTMAMTPKSQVDVMYLYYWFLSIDLGKLCTGTSVPQINNKDLNPLKLPIPPLEQQKKIVEKIEQCFELIEQL